MTVKRLENATIFQNAIDTVYDYKAHTDVEGLTHEHAVELVMEIVRCY